MATDRHPRVVRFGSFEADLHACELRKNGAKVRLPNQPFQVLAMLLAQAGDVVTRDELQKRLWADDTFVDFDRGLNKAINRLREALGDSADDPHLVETLPKRGYRFIAAIEAASQTVRDGAGAERGGSMRWSSPWLMRVAMATAVVAALGLAGSLMIGRRPPGPMNVVRSSLLPPRGTSFAPHQFALSPDGTQLAFSAANPDGTLGLWVRSLSAATARRLEQTEGARFPFWSPDNRRIGFFADRKLETVDLVNGTVRTLCVARRPRGGSWNANDVILFAPDVEGPLFQVPAAGGIPRPVSPASAHAASYNWPVFLPDGRHFLFTAADLEGRGARLYAGALDSSAPTLVLDHVTGIVAYSSNHVFFVRQGALMAQRFSTEQLRATGPAVPIVEHELDAAFEPSTPDFSVAGGAVVIQSSLDFASRLTWIDPHGREVGAVGKPGDRDPALSPDGRLLATACVDGAEQSDICVYDLERGVAIHVTHGGTDRFPVWSRDGKTLAYRAGDAALIFEVPADGSGPAHRIADLRGVPTDWSNDGHLLFFRPEQGTVALGTYAAATGGISSLGSGSEAQFSSDGRWLLYGGQEGVGVRRLPDGPRIQISAYGGAQPRWSHDGRQIFYIDAPTRNMMAVGFDPASLRATPARILFQTRIVAPALASFQYDVARDGRLLINSLPADAPPFTLLIGWSSRLN
jgi:DNA-binding winged helix-turn-helix (wHTH) protein/Tol biopolymer transport system component